VKKIETSDV